MVLKRERWLKQDVNEIEKGLQATDEVARSRGVGGLCPCHGDWDLFEQKIDVVMQSLRDPSRVVRRAALHVFDDAAVMHSKEEQKYYLEPGDEKIGEKPTLHFRSMEQRLEARANRRIERRKRTKRDYARARDRSR
jgi:hypothetical protein